MKAKKFVALLMGMLMVGFVIAANDYSLETYPEPFVKDGLYDATIVVGDGAKPEDVLGAIDVAVHLQASAKTLKEIEWKSTPSISGGEVGKVELGGEVISEIETTLTDDDIAGLQDTTMEFDGETYDVHDEIRLSAGLTIENSLTTNDEDYGKRIVMEIAQNSIEYYYVFDDDIDLDVVDEDEELDIEFLGETLTIIDVDGSDEIKVRLGTEMFIKQGELYETEDGYEIELYEVYDSGNTDVASIRVDGDEEFIEEGKSEKVGGVEIRVKSAFSSGDSPDAASIVVGSKTRKTFNDGDEYIGEDEDDPEWVWVLEDLDTTDPVIGVTYDLTRDSEDDEPAEVGECYKLPEDFVSVCLHSLTSNDYQEYTIEYDDSYDDIDDVYPGKTNEDAVVLHADDDEAFKLNGIETDEVVLWVNQNNEVEVFYMDTEDNDLKSFATIINGTTTTIASIEYKDTSLDLKVTTPSNMTVTDYVELLIDSPLTNDDLKLSTKNSGGFDGFGVTKEDAEAADLVWNGMNIGTKEDAMTRFGLVLNSIEDNLDDDVVSLGVPSDQVEAEIVVSGVDTTSETISVGYVVNQMDTPAAKLASEVKMVDTNLIIVGGPCVNPLFEEASGITCEEWPLLEGQSMIKFVDYNGGYALLIAGTMATDTRNACDALVNHELTNSETFVEGTTLFDYSISSIMPETTGFVEV